MCIGLVLLVPRVGHANPETESIAEDPELYKCKDSNAPVAVTFKPETELKDLVTWVMGFTCKSFMFDPRIVATGKKVTLIVPRQMSPTEAYGVFLGALSTIGLAVVPRGKIMRIVESHGATKEPVPLSKHGTPDDGDAYVRYVVQPTYVGGDVLLQAFNAIKSDSGDVQLAGPIVLITDYASHVREMMSLAALIDVPGGTDAIYTIPVHHADANKLVAEISALFNVAPGPAGPPAAHKPGELTSAAVSKLLVDERTNTLIIAATDAGYRRVKALVERIDPPLEIDGGVTFHVYRLGNAIAEELAKTLNDSIQSRATTPGGGPSKTGAPSTPVAPSSPDTLTLDGPVRIISDRPTNALIVMSSGRDFLAVREVIKELDQPRREVFIDAMIIEVAMDNTNKLGFAAQGGTTTPSGSAVAFGAVQSPDLSVVNVQNLSSAGGFVAGLIGSQIAGSTSLLGASIPSYGLLFQALATDSRTNVMSAPSMIALDNEETKYKVGTNIPYQKGILPTNPTNPTSQVTTNIDRQPLVLELNIKPHISNDDTVLLEVTHNSQDLAEKDPVLGPTWTTRSIETRVVVRDQQTVFIGGLMQEREILTQSSVPILGSIPVLGTLFRYTTKEKKKTDLLIMLTPYIIKDQTDLQMIQQRKQREHDEFLNSLVSLDRMHYDPAMDYRRKRGLVEEINRQLQAMDEDAAARAALHRLPPVVTGRVVPEAPATPP